jgi:hypothetical protein
MRKLQVPQATCLVEVPNVPLRVRRSTRSPGMEGTPSKIPATGAGRSGCSGRCLRSVKGKS